mgnify:CR=1 FL=1
MARLHLGVVCLDGMAEDGTSWMRCTAARLSTALLLQNFVQLMRLYGRVLSR